MNLWATLQTALAAVASNKLRAGLTLLGIVIGVASVIALMSIGRGSQQAITANIESLGTNLLFVRPGASTQGGVSAGLGSAATLTLEDAYALLDPIYSPSVQSVAPERSTNTQIVAGRENTFAPVIGVTPEYLSVRNLSLASGEFIAQPHVTSSSEVVVLGSVVSETLFGFRDPVGQVLRINGRQFTVIGTLKSRGGSALGQEDNRVMIPITTAYYRLSSQRTSQGGVSIQTINVQVKDGVSTNDVTQEVATVLRLRHRITGEDDFTISSQEETIEALRASTETFVVFLGAIASISLLVGGIGIMNIMLVSVTERTREIGIRKAVGAKRQDILLQFMSEATLLSLGGGVIGLLIGLSLSNVLDGKTLGSQTFQTAFSQDIAFLALVVSVAIGLFFGIYPAMRASRLHPIEALRHE